MKHKPNKPDNALPTPQPMAEVVGKLPAELQAKTRIVPKPTKEEIEAAIFKANKNLGKAAGHKTRY